MNIKEKQLEKNENLNEEPLKENLIVTPSQEFIITNEKENKKNSILGSLLFILITILVLCIGIFTVYNFLNTNTKY